MPRRLRLYLAELLRTNPLVALALLICLATILWCILLTRRQRNGLDKILSGGLGLLVIYDAVRILMDSGFPALAHLKSIEGWVDVTSACLYMGAANILKSSSSDRAAAEVHLRLMEADEKPFDLTNAVMASLPELSHPLLDSSPIAIFAIDARGMVTYWNPAAENLIGWTRTELIGHELPFDPRGPIQAKDGRTIAAAVWTAPIRSFQGHPSGTLIIVAGGAALREAGIDAAGKPSMAIG